MYRKYLFVTLLLVPASILRADPVDTAYDLMEAFEYGDGYALEGLLTADLYGTIDGFIDQVRAIIETDPALAENLLNSRYHGRVTLEDFAVLSNCEIMGMVMGEADLQPVEQVESEGAQMQGRNATVVIRYFDGSSISFRMSWENSGWRVADTSLLAYLFD